ncbi:MAG: ABC transporter ATP-binding protein [Anaerolineae bacterium]
MDHPFVRLMNTAQHYRGQVVIASLYSLINKLFDLAPPFLIGVAVDVVVRQDTSVLAGVFGITNLATQLWVLAGVTLVIHIGESVFQYLYQRAWRNLAQAMEHTLRTDTYEHVQRLEMAFFEDRSSGRLMSILNDDVNQLERFLDVGANEIIQVVATVIIISAVYVFTVPQIALLALLPMPIIIYGSVRFQKMLAPRYARVRDRVGLLNDILSNNLGGIATIKSFTSEAHELRRVAEQSDSYQDANRDAMRLSALFVPLIRLAIAAGLIGIMVGGGFMAFNGALEASLYATLIFLSQRLLWPLTRLGETFDLYQRAMASTARILDLLDTPSAIRGGDTPLPSVRGDIQLEGVTFSYPNTEPVVADLSLAVPAGSTLAIVGSTGAGKSTLVKLLLRFYDVQGGRITLDGHDIRDLRLQDLRRAIGLGSQDVFLFHGTVRENIVYRTFDATDAQIEEAARLAEAHDFIMRLPNGYDTIVGERGQKLSGGQRQRISIARVILNNPPVLILDEATSSVDNETEAAIQRSLDQIVKDRTTIMIAHRLSTLVHADTILVLKDGQIAEQGDHETLLGWNGLYVDMWRQQNRAYKK